jgi:hypothetical protein
MVQKIGLHQHTKENALTTFIIFICLSTDMILLPILIGYNVVEYGEHLDFLSSMFKGKNTDFGSMWYQEIGYQIVIVMIIFSL